MTQAIDLCISPKEYFRERISDAAKTQKVRITDEVEFYLVNLLCGYIHLDSESQQEQLLETPLAFLLQKAIDAPPQQQLKLYKSLGDTSLYIAGYFQESFNRKTYDISYFSSVGSMAYQACSYLAKEKQDASFASIFHDLAKQFNNYLEVVAQVADISPHSPVNILAIYDRWTKNNSDRLRKKLEEMGIQPIPIDMKIAQ